MNELKFPLFFDLRQKPVLVYGGGTIAARRVAVLQRFGADITIIAPEFDPRILENKTLRRQTGVYCPGQMPKAWLVIAATNQPDCNREITREARSRGALANNVSDRNDCDFFFPAVITGQSVSVGVCGTGEDHKAVKEAAAKIREMEHEL